MTEKRFIIIGDSNIEFIMQTQLLLPIYDNKKRLNLKACCDLLNELHEENKKLKEENEYLCEKIKENEWHWNTIDEDRDVWRYKCKTLEEENEQLKQQLISINRLIDNKIDDFKNGDYGDLPYNTIHMFLDLKEEVGDFKIKELVPITTLIKYINSKMDYYEELRSQTDGNNYVSAMAHIDMLINLKNWLECQEWVRK